MSKMSEEKTRERAEIAEKELSERTKARDKWHAEWQQASTERNQARRQLSEAQALLAEMREALANLSRELDAGVDFGHCVKLRQAWWAAKDVLAKSPSSALAAHDEEIAQKIWGAATDFAKQWGEDALLADAIRRRAGEVTP